MSTHNIFVEKLEKLEKHLLDLILLSSAMSIATNKLSKPEDLIRRSIW